MVVEILFLFLHWQKTEWEKDSSKGDVNFLFFLQMSKGKQTQLKGHFFFTCFEALTRGNSVLPLHK